MSWEIVALLMVLIITGGIVLTVWIISRESRGIRLRVMGSVFTGACSTIGAGALGKGAGVDLPFGQIVLAVFILAFLLIGGLLVIELIVTVLEALKAVSLSINERMALITAIEELAAGCREKAVLADVLKRLRE